MKHALDGVVGIPQTIFILFLVGLVGGDALLQIYHANLPLQAGFWTIMIIFAGFFVKKVVSA